MHTMETRDTVAVAFEVTAPSKRVERSYFIEASGWYRVHAPGFDQPNMASAEILGQEPRAMSRFAVQRLNETLEEMKAEAHG
jgi:hypothetical protein